MKTLCTVSIILGLATSSVFAQTAVVSTYEVKEVKDGGALSGVVTFSGKLRPPDTVAISEGSESCGHGDIVLQRLIGGADQGVANAVVIIKGIPAGKDFEGKADPHVLSQDGCVFSPHVQIMPVGARLSIKNNDTVLHNVHAFLDEKTVFNIAMPLQGQVIRKKIKIPGIMRVQCDAGHVWMSAHVVVAEHPYMAVTDTQGRYQIDGIPPGKYEVEIWHEGWDIEEKLSDGTIIYSAPVVSTEEVTIEANRTTTLDTQLSNP